MKKKAIICLIIIFTIGVLFIFAYFNAKDDIYNPVVDYQDEIIWEDIESSYISFDGNDVIGDNNGYVVGNSVLTIKSGGSYYLSGNYNGYIKVDSNSEVYLVLNNLTINSANNPAIYIENSKKTIINLETDSINNLIDNNTNQEQNATIYSKDDLVIMGTGSLNIEANNHAIGCNDTLQIINGNYNIQANNDAIRGKDYLAIKNGNFNIKTNSDGIKSTNEEDSALGYLIIDGGTFDINVKKDAIQAITTLTINDGTFNVTTEGNSYDSSKGIKSDSTIIINGGSFNIDTYDDSIHSDEVYIKGGSFEIKSGDDGIHGDSILQIDNGVINILESYEGLEATEITINEGTIHLNASDDGINCAGGNDSSGMGGMHGRPGDMFQSSNGKLYLNGGYVYVNSFGDGLDINGSGIMSGGTVIVSGPTNSGNGALDYDSTFNVDGGLFIATGSSGMLQNPSISSGQNVLSVIFEKTLDSAVCIENLITILPNKNYQSLIISSSDLVLGNTYKIYTNCEVTEEGNDGIYEEYNLGNLYKNVTISNVLTTVGSQNGMGNMPGIMGPGRR